MINEDDSISHIRTGFSKATINVGTVETSGADGNLVTLAKASFGLTTDTYQYLVSGEDDREEVPTSLDYSADVKAYKYHILTPSTNHKCLLCDCYTSSIVADVSLKKSKALSH